MENLKNEMVSISKSDLRILLETSLMMRNHMECLDITDCYNLFFQDGSESDTFYENEEYSDDDYEFMGDRIESYLTLLDNVTMSIVDFIPDDDFISDDLLKILNERRSY